MKHHPAGFVLSIILLAAIIAFAGCSGIQDSDKRGKPMGVSTVAGWQIDHAVIVVDNLSESMDKFSDAGFNVVPGGKHADDATHNALIPFKDGSYIELFAPTDPALADEMRKLVSAGTFNRAMAGSDAMQKRFMLHLAEGPGLRDFAVSYPGLNLTEEKLAAGRKGYNLDGPIPMSRTRPDGIVVKWHVVVPEFQYSASVPFLIIDDTPRSFRVPDDNLTSHPNGVTGITGIGIATHDPVAVSVWYNTVLSTTPENMSDTQATYILNSSVITIRNTTRNETEGPVDIFLGTGTGRVFSLADFAIR